MAYSDEVIDHYENPRNVGALDKKDSDVGTGLVGAPACGDVLKLQIKVDDNGMIVDAKFKAFGCGSAIASSSLVSEWVKGKNVDEALEIKNTEIAKTIDNPTSPLGVGGLTAFLPLTSPSLPFRRSFPLPQPPLLGFGGCVSRVIKNLVKPIAS